MIGHLKGRLLGKGSGWAVVDTVGIGWRVVVPTGVLDGMNEEGQEVSLFIHTSVREDAITLYGFIDAQSMDVFHTLTSIQGMGPSLAMSLLGCMSVEEMAVAIIGGDTKSLCRAHGVGGRIAARLVAELKNKAPFPELARGKPASKAMVDTTNSTARAEAIRALVRLDVSKTSATASVDDVLGANPALVKVEEIVRLALISSSRK